MIMVTLPRFTSHTINSLAPDKGMTRPSFKYPDLIGCDLFERGASTIRVIGAAMRSRQGRFVRIAPLAPPAHQTGDRKRRSIWNIEA
ncbi:hypothetical protein [Bradyrhizobium sp. CER78]|uniref:hypothetical protein n=1 Tax=Bradyrhizobium sp. CER78 TaxID=3039162 RepID=UPI00244BE996|nr:hypothetical protein [Bradyrhizobium sp. CER78]MDH2382590.1 hypothetical protein [Bradyrhizobium sp. CER78]